MAGRSPAGEAGRARRSGGRAARAKRGARLACGSGPARRCSARMRTSSAAVGEGRNGSATTRPSSSEIAAHGSPWTKATRTSPCRAGRSPARRGARARRRRLRWRGRMTSSAANVEVCVAERGGHCAILWSDLGPLYDPVRPNQCHTNLTCPTWIERAGSLTAQLAERIAADIESGVLAPGAKLPTTRELAAAASINHLTAARVYRRLAEQGYVAAHVGRGTFVRTHPPVERRRRRRGLAGRRAPAPPGLLRRADARRVAGHGSRRDPAGRRLPRRRAAARRRDPRARRAGHARRRGGLQYLQVEGLPELREQLAELGAASGFAQRAPTRSSSRPARARRSTSSRARSSGPGDVAVVESPTFAGTLTSLQAHRRAGAGRARSTRTAPTSTRSSGSSPATRSGSSPCSRPARTRPAPTSPPRAATASPRWPASAASSSSRTASTRRWPSTAASARACAPRPAARHLRRLAVQVGRRRAARRLDRRERPGPGRLVRLKIDTDMHSAALPQHLAAAWLAAAATTRTSSASCPPTAPPRRAPRRARAPPGRRGDVDRPRGGQHVWVTLRRAVDERALYGEALRGGVRFLPGRRDAGRAVGAHEPAPVVLLRRPEDLDEGVRRLARALRAVRRRQPVGATAPLS